MAQMSSVSRLMVWKNTPQMVLIFYSVWSPRKAVLKKTNDMTWKHGEWGPILYMGSFLAQPHHTQLLTSCW